MKTIFKLMLVLLMLPMAVSAQTKRANATATSFVLTPEKLGPIQIGKPITAVPKNHKGLYDKYVLKKETFADEDGEWTETYYYFYKAGKKIFSVTINDEDKTITSITLLPGSSFIKTKEGFYVGYSARELFKKKKMEWTTYFQGEVFTINQQFTYFVSSDDVTTDIPTKATDFKPNAKISKITISASE